MSQPTQETQTRDERVITKNDKLIDAKIKTFLINANANSVNERTKYADVMKDLLILQPEEQEYFIKILKDSQSSASIGINIETIPSWIYNCVDLLELFQNIRRAKNQPIDAFDTPEFAIQTHLYVATEEQLRNALEIIGSMSNTADMNLGDMDSMLSYMRISIEDRLKASEELRREFMASSEPNSTSKQSDTKRFTAIMEYAQKMAHNDNTPEQLVNIIKLNLMSESMVDSEKLKSDMYINAAEWMENNKELLEFCLTIKELVNNLMTEEEIEEVVKDKLSKFSEEDQAKILQHIDLDEIKHFMNTGNDEKISQGIRSVIEAMRTVHAAIIPEANKEDLIYDEKYVAMQNKAKETKDLGPDMPVLTDVKGSGVQIEGTEEKLRRMLGDISKAYRLYLVDKSDAHGLLNEGLGAYLRALSEEDKKLLYDNIDSKYVKSMAQELFGSEHLKDIIDGININLHIELSMKKEVENLSDISKIDIREKNKAVPGEEDILMTSELKLEDPIDLKIREVLLKLKAGVGSDKDGLDDVLLKNGSGYEQERLSGEVMVKCQDAGYELLSEEERNLLYVSMNSGLLQEILKKEWDKYEAEKMLIVIKGMKQVNRTGIKNSLKNMDDAIKAMLDKCETDPNLSTEQLLDMLKVANSYMVSTRNFEKLYEEIGGLRILHYAFREKLNILCSIVIERLIKSRDDKDALISIYPDEMHDTAKKDEDKIIDDLNAQLKEIIETASPYGDNVALKEEYKKFARGLALREPIVLLKNIDRINFMPSVLDHRDENRKAFIDIVREQGINQAIKSHADDIIEKRRLEMVRMPLLFLKGVFNLDINEAALIDYCKKLSDDELRSFYSYLASMKWFNNTEKEVDVYGNLNLNKEEISQLERLIAIVETLPNCMTIKQDYERVRIENEEYEKASLANEKIAITEVPRTSAIEGDVITSVEEPVSVPKEQPVELSKIPEHTEAREILETPETPKAQAIPVGAKTIAADVVAPKATENVVFNEEQVPEQAQQSPAVDSTQATTVAAGNSETNKAETKAKEPVAVPVVSPKIPENAKAHEAPKIPESPKPPKPPISEPPKPPISEPPKTPKHKQHEQIDTLVLIQVQEHVIDGHSNGGGLDRELRCKNLEKIVRSFKGKEPKPDALEVARVNEAIHSLLDRASKDDVNKIDSRLKEMLKKTMEKEFPEFSCNIPVPECGMDETSYRQ